MEGKHVQRVSLIYSVKGDLCITENDLTRWYSLFFFVFERELPLTRLKKALNYPAVFSHLIGSEIPPYALNCLIYKENKTKKCSFKY